MRDTNEFAEILAAELEAATALASEDVRAAVPAITRALGPALAQIRQEILVDAAESLNRQGITTNLYVRAGKSGPEFAVDSTPNVPDFDDDPVVRMTLRLPRTLRDAITTHTQTTGGSLNSWIVEAVTDKLSRRQPSANRLSGWSM